MCVKCKKLWVCGPYKLNTIAHVLGWFGIIGRITLIGFTSSIISRLSEYDPNLYKILLSTYLTYILATFLFNILFIYGIFKERRFFLLPYIAVMIFEIIIGVIVGLGMAVLFFSIRLHLVGTYIILITIAVTAVYFIFWFYSVMFYKKLEHDEMLKKDKRTDITAATVNNPS